MEKRKLVKTAEKAPFTKTKIIKNQARSRGGYMCDWATFLTNFSLFFDFPNFCQRFFMKFPKKIFRRFLQKPISYKKLRQIFRARDSLIILVETKFMLFLQPSNFTIP